MYAISYFGAEKLFSMFLENKTMISSSIRPLRLYALMFFLAGHNLFIATLSSAIENPKYSIVINIMRGSVALFLSIYLCVKILGARYLFLGALISEFLVFLIAFYSLKKMTKKPKLERA